MPVYEYYCETCRAEYELIRSVSRMDDPALCPTCGQAGRRQLSQFSFNSNTFTAPKLRPTSQGPFRSHNQDSSAASDEKT